MTDRAAELLTLSALFLIAGVASPAYASSSPTITGGAMPGVVNLGNTSVVLKANATLSGGSSPSGNITFTLYSPVNVVVDSEVVSVTGDGTYLTPVGYALPTTGSVTGKYEWVAAYGGDAKNSPISTQKGNTPATVNSAAPSLGTTPSPTSVSLGPTPPQPLEDTATLSTGYSPSGTITFNLYASSTCSGPTADTEKVTVKGNGAYGTPQGFVATTAGSYGWVATYGGDSNNNGAVGPCEQVEVAKATPTLSTSLTSTMIMVGGSTLDSAAVAASTATAGGTVTYYYYAGNTCSGSPTQVGAPTLVVYGIARNSASQQFGRAGAYSWNAIYSGDANNNAAISGCEPLTVSPASVSVFSALNSPTITVGSSTWDSASLAGATYTAGGTVTYYLYSGASCSGPPTEVGTPVTVVNGNVPNSATRQFNSAGYYSWNVAYSGDINNNGATGGCALLTVIKASPSITPALSSTAITVGKPVTDSVTLTGGFMAGGTVTYQYFSGNTCDGVSTSVGTPVSVSNNSIPSSASQIFVTVGTYSWLSTYSGDANNNHATGHCQALAVNPPGVVVSTSLSATSVSYGSSVTDSAILVGANSTTGGTVTYEFFSGNYCSGTPTEVGIGVEVKGGVVPNSSPQLFSSPGQFSWNAVYSGDTKNNGATSPCEPLTVGGQAATTLQITCHPGAVAVGTATTCTALVTTFGSAPTGKVAWTTGGAGTFLGTVCSLPSSQSGFVLNFQTRKVSCSVRFIPSAAASHLTISAAYAGDSRNSPSSGIFGLEVTKRTSLTTMTCTPKKGVAGPLTSIVCTVKVTGYLPTGVVTWTQSGVGSVSFAQTTCSLSSGTCFVAMLGGNAGTDKLQATYGGDANNAASSRVSVISLTKAPSALTVTCTLSSLTVGTTMECTSTISGVYPLHTGTVSWLKVSTSGRITFSSNTCTLSSGTCSVVAGLLASNTLTIKATYGGDANNLASHGTLVVKATPTLTPSLSATATVVGGDIIDSARLTGGFQAGGTVTYEYFSGNSCMGSATTVGSPASVVGNVVPDSSTQIFVTPGAYSWNAIYSGDTNNNGVTGPCQALVVNIPGVLVSTVLSPSIATAGNSVKDYAFLSGTSRRVGGSVTYEFFTGSYCSGTATTVWPPATVSFGYVQSSYPVYFNSPGTYSWNAVYTGDAYDNGATSACEQLIVNGIPTISVSLSSSFIVAGGSVFATSALTYVTGSAGGSVQYRYYNGGSCSGFAFAVGSPVMVADGVVPDSPSQQFGSPGWYSWNAVYSGDSSNNGAVSPCEPLVVSSTSTLSPLPAVFQRFSDLAAVLSLFGIAGVLKASSERISIGEGPTTRIIRRFR